MATLPADPQLSTRSHRTGAVFIVLCCLAIFAIVWVVWPHNRATAHPDISSSNLTDGALDSLQGV